MTVAAVWRVARMQLAVALRSPIAWLTAAGFLVLQGVSFAALITVLSDPARPAPIGAVLESHFGGTLLAWAIQLTVVAALAARTAEDRRTGLWDALVSTPIGEQVAVIGTWLGAVLLYAIVWLPTVAYVIVLAVWSPSGATIDPGPVVAGYLGGLAIGAAALALALAAGAAVRQPMAATMAGFALLMLWLIVGELPSLVPDLARAHPTLASAAARYAPRSIAIGFARGAVAPASVAWLGGVTVGGWLIAAALGGAGRRRTSTVVLATWRGILVLVAAALVAVLIERSVGPWDVTRDRRNQLAAPTAHALDRLDAPIAITIVRPGIASLAPLYDEVDRILALMVRRQPALTIARWDPARDPALATSAASAALLDERELVRGGAVVLARGARVRVVGLLDLAEVGRDAIAAPAFTRLAVEQSLARAVVELGDDAPRTLCTTRGHGERPDAWAAIWARVADDGIAIDDVELDQPVPPRCTAVAVIGAAVELPAPAQDQLRRFVDGGGALLVAVGGGATTTGVDAVLPAWGVTAGRGWVRDPDGALELPRTFRVIDRYGDHPIVAGFAGRRVTVWRDARPLAVVAPARALITTSPRGQLMEAEQVIATGTIAIAATAERGAGRLVVLTGIDAQGEVADDAGAALVAARAVAWLVGRSPEIAVATRPGDQVRLVLTSGERRAIIAVVVVGLPLVLVGLLALLARRRRP